LIPWWRTNGGNYTAKRGSGLVRPRAGDDWLPGSGAKQSGVDGSGAVGAECGPDTNQ
jgi:hypothetical protein